MVNLFKTRVIPMTSTKLTITVRSTEVRSDNDARNEIEYITVGMGGKRAVKENRTNRAEIEQVDTKGILAP